jgi:hypothetical protein
MNADERRSSTSFQQNISSGFCVEQLVSCGRWQSASSDLLRIQSKSGGCHPADTMYYWPLWRTPSGVPRRQSCRRFACTNDFSATGKRPNPLSPLDRRARRTHFCEAIDSSMRSSLIGVQGSHPGMETSLLRGGPDSRFRIWSSVCATKRKRTLRTPVASCHSEKISAPPGGVSSG